MIIGFIGLGVMGARMATRLVNAGYEVKVFNRTEEKVLPLLKLGAKKALSIGELAESSNIICTCLSMPGDVLAVYEGNGGIFQNAKPNTICIDFTTVGVENSQYLAEQAQRKDIYYLDAPVSGGPEGAASGTLTIMVGGDRSSFDQVRPTLNVLGSLVEYLGSSGMGSAAKLMNQYLVAVHSLAAVEVMVTGTSLGLKSDQLYQILSNSYGDSRMLRRHFEGHIQKRSFEPGGALKYLLKDLRLALPLMEQSGLHDTSGATAEQVLQEACDQGHANEDMSAVLLPLERKAGCIV